MYKTEEIQKCVMNLASCIQKSGGILDNKLLNMTLIQFIETTAVPNGISFTYHEPKKPCCDNCGKLMSSHCTKHLIPCCPGKCNLEGS